MIWNQLRKDLRHIAPLLVCWWLFLLAQAWQLFSATSLTGSQGPVAGFSWLWVLPQLLPIVLSAVVVLEDPVVDDGALWLSLPISGLHLSLAKITLLFFAVVLPAVFTEHVVMILRGLEPELWLVTGGELLVRKSVPVVGAAALAVIVPDLKKFFAVGVALWVARLVVWSFLPPLLSDRFEIMKDVIWVLSLPFEAPLVFVVLGGVMIFHQLLTRKTLRSFALVTVIAIGFLAFGKSRQETSSPPEMESTVTVALADPNLQQGDTKRGSRAARFGEVSLQGFVELVGQDPEDHGYALSLVSARIELDRGSVLRWENPSHGVVFPVVRNGAGLQRLLEKRGLQVREPQSLLETWRMSIVEPQVRTAEPLTTLARFQEVEISSWDDATGAYRGIFEVTAYRYELLEELPLQPGSRLREGFDELLLVGLEQERQRQLTVTLRRRMLESPIVRDSPLKHLALVLRLGTEAVPLSDHLLPSDWRRPGTLVTVDELSIPWEREWLDLAGRSQSKGLMVFQAVEIGTFTRELVIDDFRLRDYTAAAWQARLKAEISERRGMSDAPR